MPPRLAMLVFLSLAQTFAYFVPAATWNPLSRLAATQSIVERRSFALGDLAHATGDRALREGRWYSDKAPLPSIAAAPAFALMRWVQRSMHRPDPTFEASDESGIVARRLEVSPELGQLLYVCSVATSGIAGSLLGLLLARAIARRFGVRVAVASVFVVMLGTPLFPYSTSFYGHVPAALAFTTALVLLDAARPSERRLATVGFALAVAVGCEYLSAIPSAVVGLGALHAGRARPARTLLALVAGAAIPVATIAFVHTVSFGSPLRTGYSFVTNPTFAAGHARGFLGVGVPTWSSLAGLLIGERRGLFRVAPIALVGVVGLAFAIRARPQDRVVRLGAISAIALFLANAGYYMWWGGAATGPRHLVTVMPILAFGVAELLVRPRTRALVGVVATASIASMIGFVAVGLEVPESGDALFDYVVPELANGHVALRRGASNLGLRLGLPNVASLGPWLVFLVLVGRAFVVGSREDEDASDQRPDVGASVPESRGTGVPPPASPHAT